MDKNDFIAKEISNVMYKDITDGEWATLFEHKNSPLFIILRKIQDNIYSYYVNKIIDDLKANRRIDTVFYGGVLEGINESNIRTLCEEGRHRQEDWKGKKG